MTQHLDLNALQAAAEAATPGKWMWDADPVKGDPLGRRRAQVIATGRTVTRSYYTNDQGEKDAAFIAAANPAVVLALIDRLRKAEAARDGWKLVPIVPTVDMMSVFMRHMSNETTGDPVEQLVEGMALAIAAAPDSADSEGECRADQA